MISLDAVVTGRVPEVEESGSEASVLYERSFLSPSRRASFGSDAVASTQSSAHETQKISHGSNLRGSAMRRSTHSAMQLGSAGDEIKRAIREVIKTELSVFLEDFKDWFGERFHSGSLDMEKHSKLPVRPTVMDNDIDRFQLEKATTHSFDTKNAVDRMASRLPQKGIEMKMAEAIAEKDTNEVQYLLAEDCDPNMELSKFCMKGSTKTYTQCSLVAAAVISGNIEMVRMLVANNADINGTYGFKAGATSMTWNGEAIFATIRAGVGDVAMLQELMEMKANHEAVSSNGANLIWQSCYFGHVAVLNLLMQKGVKKEELDRQAESQNQKGVSHSPLHIAVIQDRGTGILEKLISKNAEIDMVNEEMKTPLLDAIIRGRVQALRILVTNGAKLAAAGITDSLKTHERPLDVLFQKSNPVMLRAAAIGLGHQEEQMKACTIDDLYNFMRCPLSKAEILEAVFKRRTLRYWNDETRHEVILKSGHIRNSKILHNSKVHRFVNCAVSHVNSATMDAYVKQKTEPDPAMKVFLNRLTRESSHGKLGWLKRTLSGYTLSLTSVNTYEAIVPAFHDDMRIIKAIADSSIHEPFLQLKSCEAILQNAWKDIWVYTFSEAFLNMVLLFVSIGLAIALGSAAPCHELKKTTCDISDVTDQILFFALVGLPIELMLLLRDMVRQVAYMTHNIRMRFMVSFVFTSNFADWVLLLILYTSQADIISNFLFRAAFALNCIARWVNVMYSMAPVRRFGLWLMPILYTVSSIGPFLTMFVLSVLAFATALVSLGVNDFWYGEAFLNVFLYGSSAEPAFLPQTEAISGGSQNGFILRSLFVLSTIFMAITMMNCFVASMVATYKTGSSSKHQLYQVRLAGEIFKHLATRHSLRRLCEGLGQHQLQVDSSYLWYAVKPDD